MSAAHQMPPATWQRQTRGSSEIVRASLKIASEIDIYTNDAISVETLP